MISQLSEPGSAVDQLRSAADRLYRRVSHWTAPRWRASVSARDDRGNADVLYPVLQQLADLTADAADEPRRKVPRLPAELAIADQLLVLAADLADTGDEARCRRGWQALQELPY